MERIASRTTTPNSSNRDDALLGAVGEIVVARIAIIVITRCCDLHDNTTDQRRWRIVQQRIKRVRGTRSSLRYWVLQRAVVTRRSQRDGAIVRRCSQLRAVQVVALRIAEQIIRDFVQRKRVVFLRIRVYNERVSVRAVCALASITSLAITSVIVVRVVGMGIATRPLDMNIVGGRNRHHVWRKIVLHRRVYLHDVTSLSTNIEVENVGRRRDTGRALANEERI